MIIIKLAKEGMAPSQIGTHLRDVYGIPDVRLVCKKKISDILDKKNLLNEIPEDLMALIRKSVMLQKHLEENHHDMSAKRGLQLTRAKIKRLVDYYKKSKKLPIDFKYDSESIKLYVG